MLNLLKPTDPRWVDAVQKDLPGLLSDHAHCELKAAQSALALVAKFADDAPEIVEPLIALAKEETDHFHQVHGRPERGEHELGSPPIDEYVKALRKAARADHREGGAPILLDRLLICALIEARSCERFKLLSEALPSEELRDFYAELMVSEARHYRLFCALAEGRFGVERARARLGILAEREAEVAGRLPLGPTVHG